MEVIWENRASEQLQQIIDYYLQTADTRTARKMLDKIEKTANCLAINPCMGPVETTLTELPHTYRSIVGHPHYKIIYRVTEGAVYIIGIWPCRQNPEKLKSMIEKE